VSARYILAALAVFFLVLAVGRIAADGGRVTIASRTWLVIAAIFGVVSVTLFAFT
jgi:hypothetical protein